jgi:multidrug efflux system outer membrane protein
MPLGCRVGPAFQKPVVESPETFRFDSIKSDTIINIAWWEIFEDEQLKSYITTALEENKELKIAAARIEEAREILGFTRADSYPVININAAVARGNINQQQGGINEDVTNLFFIAPALSWEIDFWGKFRRSNEAARAELYASEYGKRSLMISLISEIAATYFLLLDYDNRLEISKRTLQTRQEYLGIIQARFNVGYVPEIDVNQAEIQEAIAASSVPAFERLVANTEHALCILMGRNPDMIVRGEILPDQKLEPYIPPGMPSDLLLRRPDILQSEQLLAAQNARIGVAVSKRFPSISLTGLFGAASNDLSNLISNDAIVWSIGSDLFSPIYNFGKNKRRVEAERQRTEQVLLQYEINVLQAFREVEDALVAIDTYKREMNARVRQAASAKNAAMLSRNRYDGGVTSYLEVLDSDRSLFNAELSASEVYRQNLTSYIALYKALGGGWISKEEREESNGELKIEKRSKAEFMNTKE